MSVKDLPDLKGLSEQQVRGKACVWCAVALDNGSAVDLGRQETRVLDGRISWFPRACPACAKGGKRQLADETYVAYLRHLEGCLGCATADAPCEEGEQLRSAHREALRS